MLKLLETKHKTDFSQGTTNFGPHRDDFRFTLEGIDANAFASQGEVRLMVLSVTIALIAYLTTLTGDTPVVLLDDVLSELDKDKQNRLINRLLHYGAQTIVTATALTEIDHRVLQGARTYHVDNGVIKEERQHG
jgi:DNA replication and repair protein RecF